MIIKQTINDTKKPMFQWSLHMQPSFPVKTVCHTCHTGGKSDVTVFHSSSLIS